MEIIARTGCLVCRRFFFVAIYRESTIHSGVLLIQPGTDLALEFCVYNKNTQKECANVALRSIPCSNETLGFFTLAKAMQALEYAVVLTHKKTSHDNPRLTLPTSRPPGSSSPNLPLT